MARPKKSDIVIETVKPEAGIDLYALAAAEAEGYTLLPVGKAEVNPTVEVVEPRVERGGKVVCKRK